MADLTHINLKPDPVIGRTPTEEEKQGMRQTLGLDSVVHTNKTAAQNIPYATAGRLVVTGAGVAEGTAPFQVGGTTMQMNGSISAQHITLSSGVTNTGGNSTIANLSATGAPLNSAGGVNIPEGGNYFVNDFPVVSATHLHLSNEGTYTRIEADKIINNGGTLTLPAGGGTILSSVSNLDATKLTGTIADARIPNLNASKTTAGVFADARIPDTVARVADVSQQMLTRQPAGGLTFNGDGSGGYGTLPDINLAGGQLGIFFVYRKLVASVANAAGIITRARVGVSADGGWSILDRSGQSGEQLVAIRLNDGRFAGNDSPNWPLTLSDLPVGSVSTWGFNLDNSSDPADLDLEFFLNGASQGQRTVTGSDAYRDSPLAKTHIATSTALSGFSALGISGLVIANRPITPTEYAELHASGGAIVPVSLRRTGMDYASDFATTNGWRVIGTSTSSVVTANNTVGGETEVLTLDAVEPANHQCYRPGMGWVAGLSYRISARVYVPSSNLSCDGVRLMANNGTILLQAIRPPMDTWVTVENVAVFPSDANTSDLYLRMVVNTSGTGSVPGDSVSIKDVVIEQLGATMHFPCDDGNNYQCRDMISGGESMLLSPTGATHDIARTPWKLSATRTGSGWIEGDRPMLDAGAEIEYASVTCSEAGTVSLGYNSANGATHFTATHPGGDARIRVPIADTSPGVSDRRLYLTVPAGAVVSINLTGNIR